MEQVIQQLLCAESRTLEGPSFSFWHAQSIHIGALKASGNRWLWLLKSLIHIIDISRRIDCADIGL